MNRWPKARFSDFAKEISRPVSLTPGVLYRSVGVKWYGEGVHVHETRDGLDFNADRFEIHADDLIYNDMWARQGSVAIVPAELSGAVASSHFPTFKLNREIVEPSYLSWYFKRPSFWDDCEDASRGSTGRNQIKRRTFLAIPISLPPVTEQQQIVARIEALASKVQEARSLNQHAAVEGEIITTAAVAKLLGSIKANQWRPISSVARFINGKAFKPHEWSETGLPIVRIQNLNDETTPFNYCSFEVDDRFMIDTDELLLSWSGTPGTSFGAHIWRRGRAVLNQHIFKVLVDATLVIKTFFRVAVNFKLREMISEAHGGVGLQHITKAKLDKILVPVPALSEQRRIVAYLDGFQTKVDRLIKLQTETATELDALLPSILDKAFKGEL